MSDWAFSFTIATVAEPGLAATKRIVRLSDGRLEKSDYDRVALWRFQPMAAASVAIMAEVLRDLAGRADRMILMGRPRPGLLLDRPQLRRWAAADPSTNTLEAVDRQWLPIDIDDVAVPSPLGRGDRLDDAARYVRDTVLPPEFHGIAAAATATSSSGLKGDTLARLRLFFALDRPLSLDVLRLWARGARAAGLPVDPAVIQAGQPIYTARPLFRGIADPVPPRLRAFGLEGSRGDRVSLVADRYEAAPSRTDQAATARASTNAGRLAAIHASRGGRARQLLRSPDASIGRRGSRPLRRKRSYRFRSDAGHCARRPRSRGALQRRLDARDPPALQGGRPRRGGAAQITAL